MPSHDPFTPVPLTRKSQPIVLRRDRRGVSMEDHLTQGTVDSRLNTHKPHHSVAMISMISVLAIMVSRIAYLQVLRGDEYRSSAEQNRIRLEILQAPRGIIYDRDQKPLLSNVPNFTLVAVPSDLPRTAEDRVAVADQLAAVAPELRNDAIRTMLITSTPGSVQPLILLEHVPYEMALRLTTAVARMPGISLRAVGTRSYTKNETMAHLLGYLGKPSKKELETNAGYSTLTQIGRMGIEQYYDTNLRGTDGIREVERDHLNKELSVVASRDPVPGNNLITGIDTTLQETLYDSLQTSVKALHLQGASAVALDPRTGTIRALVSYPSFNPNLFTQGGSVEEFNAIFNDDTYPLVFRPISGTYPSGSTIKPVITSAALNERVVTEGTTVSSTGGIKVGPNFFPDWKSGGHGVTNVTKALAESVNTFFYMIGGGFENFVGLGIDRIVEYLKLFGLAKPLGIDLPGEASGFLPDKEWRSKASSPKWYLGDTYNLSIGQGFISVTPIQVASYTAAIANGGTLYQPHVVTSILEPDDTTQSTIAPVRIRSTVPDSVLSIVRKGMRQAVTSGSARGLGNLPVTVAAKTGTAQFGNEGKTHAWLTSFAPFERPEIVLTVLIEGGGEGSATALPIVRKALETYFTKPVQMP